MEYKGVPHVTTEDDVYEGFLIPKGSWIISNIWSVRCATTVNCVLTDLCFDVGRFYMTRRRTRIRRHSTPSDSLGRTHNLILETIVLVMEEGAYRFIMHAMLF